MQSRLLSGRLVHLNGCRSGWPQAQVGRASLAAGRVRLWASPELVLADGFPPRRARDDNRWTLSIERRLASAQSR